MSAPIRFTDAERISDPSLHMAYHFEDVRVTGSKTDSTGLPGLPALKIDLENRSANPAMSLSVKQVTSLFTLYSIRLTKWYPSKADPGTNMALVFEGYHHSSPNVERLLLFIPVSKGVGESNPFLPLENAIETPQTLDLNGLIPNQPFSYYTHKGDVLYHMVFFETSDLKYTKTYTFAEIVPTKIPTLYLSNDNPVHRTALSGNFEDNIYIDCVPVQTEKPTVYMKQTAELTLGFDSTNLISMLVVSAYVILIVLFVYGMYKLAMYVTSNLSKASPSGAPLSSPGPRTAS